MRISLKNLIEKLKLTEIKKKLKHLKSFSIMIIPDHAGRGAQSRHVFFNQIAFYATIYTLLVALLGFILFSFSPVKGWLFPSQTNLSSSDLKIVNELNKKMIFLSRELEELKSTNEKLRYAITLGDSSLLDSIKFEKQKSENSNKLKIEGSLFAVIRDFFSGGKDNNDKSYYFYNPVNAFVSREFKPENGHLGVDYVLKTGTPVFAAASGYIAFSDYTASSGYMIIIVHPDDYITVYKHCSLLIKKERERVLQGELIALSGNTGEITTGPHLHFEVWKNGKPIDPKEILINY